MKIVSKNKPFPENLFGIGLAALIVSGCSAAYIQIPLSEEKGRQKYKRPEYAMHMPKPTTREQLAELIKYEAKRQGVDPKFALAIAYVESRINPNVGNSWAGAIGGMQVMPGTARAFDPSLTAAQIKDPRINVPLGIAYLKLGLLKNAGSMEAAAANYEAGIYSGRKTSGYARKALAAKNNSVVTALHGDNAFHGFFAFSSSPKADNKSAKDQSRIGAIKGFGPIDSNIYDPSRFTRERLDRGA